MRFSIETLARDYAMHMLITAANTALSLSQGAAPLPVPDSVVI